MRIIAAKRDYYDCLQKSDEDWQTLYLRTPRTEHLHNWPFPYVSLVLGNIDCEVIVIGFCGRIYPCLNLGVADTASALCWNADQVAEFIRQHGSDITKLFHFSRLTKRQYRRAGGQQRRIVAFFQECARGQDKWKPFFDAHRTPIFVARRSRLKYLLECNALLSPFEFYRFIPPAQAYQEVRVWIENTAVPLKPMPEIDDETLAAAKGFDRHSFRQDPIRKRKR
jgi:hypothetical protein